MNSKKERKEVDMDRSSYIRMFIYIFLIIITGTALLMLSYQPTVGKAYTFSSERITGTLNLPDTKEIEEIFTVELDLDVSDVDTGILLIADIDPGLKIVKPVSDGLVGENTITWTLFPEDQIVSFDVLGNSSGDFNVSMTWIVGDEQGSVFEVLSIVTCEANETQNYTCADGSVVPWCVCAENGEWSCVLSPEIACIGVCLSDDDCLETQFCEFDGCAAETGVCIETPEQCPTLYEPVCGCDNQTYSNDCTRKLAEVSKAYDGECILEPVECVEPTDGMIITEDTKLCDGIYNLPNGISIGADDVELDCDGAVLDGDGLNNGITVDARNNIVIKNCNIEDYRIDIYLEDSSNIEIMNNSLTAFTENVRALIASINSNILNIKSNDIENFGDGHGIWIRNSAGLNIIRDNVIITHSYDSNGIRVENSANTQILNNDITTYHAYGFGVYISVSPNSVISYNDIKTHRERAHGVFLMFQNDTVISYNDISINSSYTIPQTDIILYDQTFPIEEREAYNNQIIDNIVNGICSCNSEDGVTAEEGIVGQAFETLVEDVDVNHTYVCTRIEPDVYVIVDIIDKNGIIETNELINAINRWVTDEVTTEILLEAINLWIGK